jgi:flagellar basal-body rod protein FlgC
MISSINNSALSGLRAFSTGLQSNANNVANANTNGFKKARVTMATTEPIGVKANVEKVNSTGAVIYAEGTSGSKEVELSNVDLGQELPEMSLNSNFYKANLKTLQVADEMVGSLLKLKA